MLPTTPRPAGGRPDRAGSDDFCLAAQSRLEIPHPLQPKQTPRLNRETFHTSRVLDFCSQKELVAQTGHEVEAWPAAIVKEATDNSLDACEEAGIAPQITVSVSTGTGEISITDNGPGIPNDTIAGILDYTARVSSREAYCSPARGAQGNALKTLLAMAFALSGDRGETGDRGPGAGAPHRLPGRSRTPGTADCARGLDLFCKKRHCDSGALAGVKLAQS